MDNSMLATKSNQSHVYGKWMDKFLFVDSLSSSDAHMRGQGLVQAIACHLPVAKPLSELMLITKNRDRAYRKCTYKVLQVNSK